MSIEPMKIFVDIVDGLSEVGSTPPSVQIIPLDWDTDGDPDAEKDLIDVMLQHVPDIRLREISTFIREILGKEYNYG